MSSVRRVASLAQMALHKTLLFSALLALAWAQDEEPLTDEEKMKKKHDEVASYPYCMEDNCYELLGSQGRGGLPIKRAYRKLASEWHLDKNPTRAPRRSSRSTPTRTSPLEPPGERRARPAPNPPEPEPKPNLSLSLSLTLDAREL